MKLWISLLFIFGLLSLSGFAVIGDDDDDGMAYASSHDVSPFITSASLVGETYVKLEMSEPVFDNNNIPPTDFKVISVDPPVSITAVEISGSTIILRLSYIPVTALSDIHMTFTQSGSSAITDADGNRLGNYMVTQFVVDGRPVSCIPSFRPCITLTDGGDPPLVLKHIRTIQGTDVPGGIYDNPGGVAVGPNSNIYVSDSGNSRVLEFTRGGMYVKQFGEGTTSSPDQYARPGGLGIAVNSTGHIYVVDAANDLIRIYNPDGTLDSEISRTFGTIHDIDIGPNGKIYVTDHLQERIYIFNPDGTYDTLFGNRFGGGDGEFRDLQGIAINTLGHIYIADTNNNRIQIFDSDGNYLNQFGNVTAPLYIALDAKSNVYVTEPRDDFIKIFDSGGRFLTQLGSNGSGAGEFNRPRGVEVDSGNNLHVVDSGNNRIQIFSIPLSTTILETSADSPTSDNPIPFNVQFEDLVFGFEPSAITKTSGTIHTFGVDYHRQSFGESGTEDGQFSFPHGIALNSARNIYVVTGGPDTVQIFNTNSQFIGKFGGEGAGNGQFVNPTGIAIGPDDRIYVADSGNNRVQIFNSDGTYQSQFGSEGSENGEFNRPVGVALSSTGHIFVADSGNNRIQIFQHDGTYQRQFGGLGTGNGMFNSPVGITIDYNNYVYVADSANNRVQIFSFDGTYQSQFNSAGSDPGQFLEPSGITLDYAGNIYVSDSSKGIIQIFDNDGIYQSPIDTIPLGDVNRLFTYPVGITTDQTGRVYIVEASANRVSIFTPQSSYAFSIIDPTDQETLTVGISNSAARDVEGFGTSLSNVISLDIDRSIPAVSSAITLNVTSILVTLTESVSGNNIIPGDFTIDNVTTPTIVSAADVNGTDITLTLSTAITDADVPTLSYTPTSTSISDATGNQLVAFSAQSITNDLDTTAPAVFSVYSPEESSLIVRTTEPVTAAGDVSPGSFVISGTGSPLSVTAVDFAVNASDRITLALSAPLATSDQGDVLLSYTADLDNAISDAAGNRLASFSNVALSPLPVITLKSGTTDSTNITPIPFVARTSNAVTGFDVGDIVVDGADPLVYLQTIGMTRQSSTADGEFDRPRAIMQHSGGNIYVAEFSNHRIQIFDGDTGQYIGKFGSSGLDNGELNNPTDILQHSNGNIYIADSGNDRIQVFNGTTHAYISQFGSNGRDNGEFNSPTGIIQHSDGNIYVTDSGNYRVQIFNGTTHAYISQFGSNGPGNGEFGALGALMQHSDGNIYVVDSDNDRIQVFNGTLPHAYISQFGSIGVTDGKFNNPVDIMQHSNGDIYIADTSNNRIQVFNGTLPHAYLSQFGSHGSADGEFSNPNNVIQHSNGNIYVSDSDNHRVEVFTPSHGTVQNFAVSDIPTYIQTLGTTGVSDSTDGQFNSPDSVTQHSNGNIYVTDSNNNRVQVFDGDTGQYVRKFGSSGSGDGLLSSPADIMQHTNGNIYVTDSNNHRVQIFNGTTHAYISQFGSSGSEDGEFQYPADLMQHSNGNIYVNDLLNNRVQIFNGTTHAYISQFGGRGTDNGEFNNVGDLMQHSNGNIYATDLYNHRIQIFNGTTHAYISQFGSNGTGDGDFNSPAGIIQASNGNIHIVDNANNRIQIFNGTTHAYISQFGSQGDGDDEFDAPNSIIQASNGDIYVSDRNNHRIQIFSTLPAYNFDVTPYVDPSTITVTVSADAVFDVDGSGNLVSNTVTVHYDSALDLTPPALISAYVIDATTVGLEISEPLSGSNPSLGDFVVGGVSSNPSVMAVDIPGGISIITLTLSGEITDDDPAPTLSYTANPNNLITDLSSHPLASFSGVVIGRPPLATLSIVGDISSPTNINLIPLTLSFNENVTGFDVADINTTSGIVQNLRISISSPSPVYNFEVAQPTPQETLNIVVPSGAVASVGNATNTNPSSNVISLYIDTIPPVVTYTGTRTSTSIITLELSEPLFEATNIPPADFVVSGDDIVPTVTAVNIQDAVMTLALSNPISTTIDTFVLRYSPTNNNINITDLAGNSMVPFSEILIDTPVVVSLTTNVTSPSSLSIIPFVARFSENVTRFDATGIASSSGTTQNLASVPDSLIRIITSANSQDLLFPRGIEFDSQGNFYVTDAGNGRVIIFDGDGEFLREFQTNGTSRGLALNSTDHIFVTNIADHRVLIYHNNGTFLSEFGINVCGESDVSLTDSDIAVDSDDNLYVSNSDNDCIQTYDNNGEYIDGFGGSGSTDGAFALPVGVTLDSAGKIYVADKNNNRIQIFNGTTYEYIRQFGSTGSNNKQFDSPTDITVGTDGRVYITDTSNNRIQMFNSQDKYITAFTHTTPGGALDDPTGIAIDANNNLYVVESSANRIRIFSSTPTYTFDILDPISPSTLNVTVSSGAVQNADSVDNAPSNTVSIFIDRTTLDVTRPTVAITAGVTSPTNAEPVPFTITFSESVTGFTASDIVTSSGTVQSISPTPSQSVMSYAFSVADSADGAVLSVHMPADMVQDGNSNANTASNTASVSVDRTAPTVTAATVIDTLTIRLALSESVFANGMVTPSDFAITGAATGNPTVTAITITNNTDVITLTLSPPISGTDTALFVSYTQGTNRIADAAANPLASFSNQGVTNTLDPTRPTVAITSGVTSPTNAEPVPFTITFSESVTGFTTSDIIASSGTVQSISPAPSQSATSYTFSVAGSANGAVLDVSMSAGMVHDTDNNANTASNTASVSVDRTAPTVTAATVIDISTIRLALSEPVLANGIVTPSDFVIAGVATGNPTVTGVTVTANTDTVTLTLSAPVSATDTALLVSYTQGTNRIADAAANPLASFSNRAVTNTLDPSIPTVTLTTVVTSPTDLNLIPFTVQFSENVSGFDTSGITLSSGTIQNLTPASPSPPAVSLYTFNVVNPTDQATLTVIIPAGAAQNANIVGNAASNPISLDIEMDTIIRPTPPTRSGGGGGGGESIPPSLTTSFDDDFESITINNVGISPNKFNDVYMQSPPISASTGVQTPIQIVLYENIAWNLVSHVELCMNKAVVANQVCYSDTKVIWDKSNGGNNLEIIDPNNLINDDNTTVDRSKVNDNVVTFDFDIEFVDTMKVSDLRIYAWDTNRNALVYTVENAFRVIPGSSSSSSVGDGNIVAPGTSTIDNSNNNSNNNNNSGNNNTDTTNNDNSSTTSPVTLDRELLKQWTGFASESISDAEFLTHAGIYNKDSSSNNNGTFDVDDDASLPNWTKNVVGKWALQGKISTVELKATLSYMHKLINDEKH